METWRRNQVAVTAASFVGFTGFTMVMPFLALYIQELGVTDVGDVALWSGLTLGLGSRPSEPEAAVLVGVLFSVLAVCAALGNQLAAALLTRGTTRAVIVGSLLVASGALAAFALVRSAWSMTITIAAFGAAIGTALTTTFTTAGSVVPRTAHGLVSVFSRVRR